MTAMNERAQRAIANTLALIQSGDKMLERFAHHKFIAGKRYMTLLAVTLDDKHVPVWEAAVLHPHGVAEERRSAVWVHLLDMLDGCGQVGESLERGVVPDEGKLFIPSDYTELRMVRSVALVVYRRMTAEEIEQVYQHAPALRAFQLPERAPGFSVPVVP